MAREVSDPAAHEALAAYLLASGRGNVLGSERPLWTRHDRAGKGGAPLTSRAFVENLKAYAKSAGLSHIHLHQTRHTYARIVAEETGSFIEAQELSTIRTRRRPVFMSSASRSRRTSTPGASPAG